MGFGSSGELLFRELLFPIMEQAPIPGRMTVARTPIRRGDQAMPPKVWGLLAEGYNVKTDLGQEVAHVFRRCHSYQIMMETDQLP